MVIREPGAQTVADLGRVFATAGEQRSDAIVILSSPIFGTNPKLIAEECAADLNITSNTCSDRKARWIALMREHKGKIDAEAAKSFHPRLGGRGSAGFPPQPLPQRVR
jgi:uncharacterized protein YqfA (UPF0365 family)